MIHEIKNLGKIEALLGSIIIGLAGLVAAKFQIGEMVDVLILVLIVILVITIIMLQLLYYLKYIVQKEMWIREQEIAEPLDGVWYRTCHQPHPFRPRR